jgi:undecaprenyl-diphosphatase
MAIWLRNRRAGWVALALATVLSISRVVVGTHYPTDVLAGAALGSAAALLLWLPAVRRPLHGLADYAGTLYERVATAVLVPFRRYAR